VPLFFEVTPPAGDKGTLGPFPTQAEAEACRSAVIADKPDHTVGEIFPEGSDYLNTLPRPYARIVNGDGSFQELWTDGTSKNIPA
jgi:hypothetical protein